MIDDPSTKRFDEIPVGRLCRDTATKRWYRRLPDVAGQPYGLRDDGEVIPFAPGHPVMTEIPKG